MQPTLELMSMMLHRKLTFITSTVSANATIDLVVPPDIVDATLLPLRLNDDRYMPHPLHPF